MKMKAEPIGTDDVDDGLVFAQATLGIFTMTCRLPSDTRIFSAIFSLWLCGDLFVQDGIQRTASTKVLVDHQMEVAADVSALNTLRRVLPRQKKYRSLSLLLNLSLHSILYLDSRAIPLLQ